MSREVLIDDLADVLARMVVGWKDQLGVDLAEHPEVHRVMARYRDEREEHQRTLELGARVKVDCAISGNAMFQYQAGECVRVNPSEYVVTILPPERQPSEVIHRVTYQCRKCGTAITYDQFRFGSPTTGWEHMEGECVGEHQ